MGRSLLPFLLVLCALQGCGAGRADDPPSGRRTEKPSAGVPASEVCRDFLAGVRILRGGEEWICDLPAAIHPQVVRITLDLPGGERRSWKKEGSAGASCTFRIPLSVAGPIVLTATDEAGRSATRKITL